jgi:hypothetical protein
MNDDHMTHIERGMIHSKLLIETKTKKRTLFLPNTTTTLKQKNPLVRHIIIKKIRI